MVRDDQPDAREGQAGRRGESERFIVPMKPGNSGGGKEPRDAAAATTLGLAHQPNDGSTNDKFNYLRVCPETSGTIAKFSEHEAD